jgi:tRNA modification GTPase
MNWILQSILSKFVKIFQGINTCMSIKSFQNDTICAISTPFGTGAISVIRLSGIEAIHICNKVFIPNNKNLDLKSASSHTLYIGKIFNDDKSLLDEVIVGIFKNPYSYTGEDIVEISCHGSVFIQEQLIQLLIRNGARPAKPGEFTLRAFLNGKLDLAQAEAVADLISSNSTAAHKLAINQMKGGFSEQIKLLRDRLIEFTALLELELDFSEEDVEFANRGKLKELLVKIKTEVSALLESYSLGNVLKSGIPVAIIGKPNVGKSTLLNILLNEDRAIVSEMPGTTRDAIEDTMIINGVCFRFIDTAGLRKATDKIEHIGIERTYEKIATASVIIYLFDISEENIEEIKIAINEIKDKAGDASKKIILVANKTDKLNEVPKGFKDIVEFDTIFISAKRRENINLLTERLVKSVSDDLLNINGTVVTSSRHYEALHRSMDSLAEASKALNDGISNDLLATHIRTALHYLGEITGDITTEEILDSIFSKFCIGK